MIFGKGSYVYSYDNACDDPDRLTKGVTGLAANQSGDSRNILISLLIPFQEIFSPNLIEPPAPAGTRFRGDPRRAEQSYNSLNRLKCSGRALRLGLSTFLVLARFRSLGCGNVSCGTLLASNGL